MLSLGPISFFKVLSLGAVNPISLRYVTLPTLQAQIRTPPPHYFPALSFQCPSVTHMFRHAPAQPALSFPPPPPPPDSFLVRSPIPLWCWIILSPCRAPTFISHFRTGPRWLCSPHPTFSPIDFNLVHNCHLDPSFFSLPRDSSPYFGTPPSPPLCNAVALIFFPAAPYFSHARHCLTFN